MLGSTGGPNVRTTSSSDQDGDITGGKKIVNEKTDAGTGRQNISSKKAEGANDATANENSDNVDKDTNRGQPPADNDEDRSEETADGDQDAKRGRDETNGKDDPVNYSDGNDDIAGPKQDKAIDIVHKAGSYGRDGDDDDSDNQNADNIDRNQDSELHDDDDADGVDSVQDRQLDDGDDGDDDDDDDDINGGDLNNKQNRELDNDVKADDSDSNVDGIDIRRKDDEDDDLKRARNEAAKLPSKASQQSDVFRSILLSSSMCFVSLVVLPVHAFSSHFS